jgi:hypothetical protein
MTGNPGGPGQLWIKNRYIDPAPMGMKILARKLPNGREHRYVFIPSKLQNNSILMRNDPEYINRLYLVGSQQLVQAWLDGDWSAIAGAFFTEFSAERHIVRPFTIPKHWVRMRSCDWGSAKPFSVGWYAVSDGEFEQYPRGALIKYREWYGIATDEKGDFQPNVGLKLTAEEVADGILARQEADEHIDMSVIDPAAFQVNGGPSIAERMSLRKVYFQHADNTRVASRGAMNGWDSVRSRLKGEEDGQPMLFFFSTCVHTIRTLPALQHDSVRAEDVDTSGEDHAPDETRYMCSARSWVRTPPKSTQPKFPINMSVTELIAQRTKKRKAQD